MRGVSRSWLVVVPILAVLSFSACFAAEETVGVAKVGSSNTITLDLRDIDVKSAIEAVFRNTGKNFSIDQNVAGVIPSLSFKDVPFDTALKNLTKSAGLVYRVDASVYLISKRPQTTASMNQAPPPGYADPGAGYVEATTQSEIRIDKIPLNFASANEILAAMDGSTSRDYGGSNNYGNYGGGHGSNYGNNNRNYGGYSGGYNGGGNYGGYTNTYSGNSGYSGYGGSRNYGGYGGTGGGYGSYRGW